MATEALQREIKSISLGCAKFPALEYIGHAVDGDLQNSQTQNKHDRRLSLPAHLDVPDHEDRQQRVEPIRDYIHYAERIRCADDLLGGDALRPGDRVVPLRLYGGALEGVPECERNAPDRDNHHADAQDPDEALGHGDVE